MKKIRKLISVIIAAAIIAGVAVIAPITVSAESYDWKSAYIDQVDTRREFMSDSGWFRLYDFDKNGIPEMIWNSGYGLSGGEVETFYDDEISGISFGGDGRIMILNDMFYVSSGRQGYYRDKVYKINGTGRVIFDGYMQANTPNFQAINDNYFKFYIADGNNYKQVKLAEYNKRLGSVFNQSKATKLTRSNCCNADQVISAINNYSIPFGAINVALANNAQGIYASWNKSPYAARYNVFYKKSSDSGWSSFSTANNFTQFSNIVSGGQYYVQVQPVAACGDKGGFSKLKGMTYVAQPVITSLTYNGSNTLKWNAVGGANKYQIARLKSGDKAYTYFTTTKNSFTESAVGGVAYTYQVRAMYATSNSGTAYGAWSSAKSVATLVAPTVTLSNQANAVMVKWNAIKGTKKYIVYFKSANQSSWKTATTTNTSLPISGVVSGTNYYVQVRPIGSTVNGPFSAPKNIIHITTIKPTLKLSNKSNGIRAEWNAFRDAKSYTVYYKSASASNWSSVTTANTYYPLLNLRSGTRYYVQVQPNFGSYKGAYSAVNSLVYQPVSQATKPVTTSYVLNTSSRVFHRSDCASVSRMNAANKSFFNGTRQQAINMGYTPCQNCNP